MKTTRLLVALLLALSASTRAATYTVTTASNAGAGSLRDAISQANANPGADTIVFDTAGVFSTSQSITLSGGQMIITGALAIDAPSAVARRVTVDANNGSRIFSVQLTGAGTVSLSHLTLRDGLTTDDGGGIRIDSPAGSTLELVDCEVRFCDARDGGGIDAGSSNLVLTNSFLSNNTATRHGGGLIARGIVTMTGGNCDSNEAVSDGGGIFADGASLSISTADIRYNDAQRGGGVHAKGGAVVAMTGGSVGYNIAAGDGGGLRAAGSSSLILLGVAIGNNDAENGAGLAIRSSTLAATNCLITRNDANGGVGGGIRFRGGTARLKNCTIVNNSAVLGGGIHAETTGVQLGNTVVANTPSYLNNRLAGSFVTLGHNFIGDLDTATGFANGVDGDIVGETSTLDPGLDPVTYAPLARSRCLENGDSSLVTSPTYGPGPFVDQVGNPRVRGMVDLGAIEGTFNAIVTNNADSGAGSLRDALTTSPTDISFDPVYFGATLRTITLTSGQIALSTDITLVGPAPGVIISGNNASRVFNITGGAVTLQRIRIINGSSTGDGGGIRVVNNGTSLTLDDAGVSLSTAVGRGGGLYMQDSSTVSITNSTFTGDAADGDGGAIHINGGTLKVTNSTFSNNTSKQGGGGLFSTTGTTTLINCTLAENTADSDNAAPTGNGGGIRRTAGTVSVGNSIVGKNTDASSGVVHPDISGVFTSLGHNLIGKTDGLDGSSGTPFQNGMNGDLAGTIASPLNPQLGALALVPANSPTRVHPLLLASSAREAGDPALLTHAAWPAKPAADQRGQFRTVGSAVDIGAVEYPDTNIAKVTTENGSTSEHTLAAAAFRIRRSYDNGAAQVVNFAIHASTTASATDYTFSDASYTSTGATTFTVTIPAGRTSVLLNVTPTQDPTAEGVEVLALTIAAGAGYVTDSGGVNLASVSIYDDEYTVTSSASSGAGTLREAINNANSGGGGIITMPANASVALGGTELTIASEIEIIGNNSTINAGGLSRVMVVNSFGGSPVILRNLRLTGGYTTFDGGGLFVNAYTDLEMRGCTIIGNSAASDAGGLAVAAYALLTMTNCSVMDNTAAGIGGGLWAAYGDLLFTNVTIGGNRAGSYGGGIYANNMTGTLINCTITQNLAASGNSIGFGGGGGLYASTAATLVLSNSVVAGNFDTPGNGGSGVISPDVAGVGSFAGSIFNFIGSNAGNSFTAGQPNGGNNYVGTAPSPLNPQLQRVNGPTDTYYEFIPGSLLFDHGSNALATSANDQRGIARIHNGTVDIGAVEMDFLLVTNTLNTGAGSLRNVLAAAAMLGHGTVVFDTGVFNVPRTIALTSDLVVTSSVVVSGPSDAGAQLTISGNGFFRPFRITPAAPAQVELRNLDLINGSATSIAAGLRGGGGVLVEGASTLILTGCEIRNCTTTTEGGAINVGTGGALFASDCTFSSNVATLLGGALHNLGTIALERVTLRDNTTSGDGGGLANILSGTLTNCTFSNNRANNHGGAISNTAGAADTLTLTHSTLTLNRSNNDSSGGGNGGGIRRTSGIVAVKNTLISGNDALAGTHDDLSGAFTSLGNNLIGISTGGTGFTHGVNGDLIGANAHLGPLQNNGGPTFTHALLAGSAAIDTALLIANSTDQRGVLRNGALNDIGAYELLPETYAYWAAHTFPTNPNAGENQDYDGDGLRNGFEWGAGSDPLNALSRPVVTPSVSGGNYHADFTASPLAPVRYDVLRFSTDLATWQNVANNLYTVTGTDPVRNVILYRVSVPVSFATKFFLRLERLP